MRPAPLLIAAALCLSAGVTSQAAPPPLPAEKLTVETLPPQSPHWVYVFDEAFDNEIDQRVHLFRRRHAIGGSARSTPASRPGFNLSPDGTTERGRDHLLRRGSRGARTDVVEFTDNTTLAPDARNRSAANKRAMTCRTYFNVGYSCRRPFRVRLLRDAGGLLRGA